MNAARAAHAATLLDSIYQALQDYRAVVGDRYALDDLLAYQILDGYTEGGDIADAKAAMTLALLNDVDFAPGDPEYRYDKARDDVYDFLSEHGLLDEEG